jgi:dolichyl-phosphate beta-glucosyltransferase
MITVIIPCYNEAERLPPTLREIEKFYTKYPDQITEVLIVDDGSRDATIEKALYFKDRLPLRTHVCAENRGKWAATNLGIMQSKGLLLLMDADGAAGIWNLETEGKVLLPDKRYAVFGTRFKKESVVTGKSFLRTVVSHGYRMYVKFWYFIAKGMQGQVIDDMQCPFKLFWKEDLQMPLLCERFSGDLELACRLNATIINNAIVFHHVRGSKVPLSAVWQMFLETPKIALAQRYVKEKMYHE